MKSIKIAGGITLVPIPVSPNSDYMAGDDGQIYSCTHYAGFGRKDRVEWYALKGHQSKKGYSIVSLCHENKKVTKSVHRLICMAFHGMPPKASMQVRHLDGNPENNLPANLMWGTQEENWQDREAHGNGISGERHHAAKLTNKERSHLKWALKMGLCSQRHAGRILGITQSSISHLVTTWPDD